jgi:outer membrane receptor protein involved in Fe transport
MAASSNTSIHEALDRLHCARVSARRLAKGRSLRVSWIPFIVITAALPSLAAAADDAQSGKLEEVIVTAQKKSERLQDVPIPVTQVDADSLIEANQVRLQDFYTKFPGLTLTVAQQSAIYLQVRGLPTAITIDDTPISIGAFLEQAGGLALDLDPSGLSQIEVLRGPQGTLYGANSEGGLLRYVTADPTSERLKGRMDVGINSIRNGDQPGWRFRGQANVPISENAGLLIDGFARQDAGYIDNPILGKEGVNESHTYGTHMSFLWHATDALSVKLGAFFQRSTGDGTNDVNVVPGLGRYDQNYIASVGHFQRTGQLYNATVKYKADKFEITSVTGYVWTGFRDTVDGTLSGLVPYSQFGIPGTDFTGFGVAGLTTPESAHSHSITQEVRLTTQIGSFVDVLLGGFYNYAYGTFGEELAAVEPATGETAGLFDFVAFSSAARSYAAFTNLNFHLSDRFHVQVGGRQEYDNTYGYGTTFTGPGNPLIGAPTPDYTLFPAPDGKSRKFTYLVTPQYKLTPDAMLYARVATGYAPGQANPAAPGVPSTSKPDTVLDYELGMKTERLDHRWFIDASVFHIKHDDIQAGLFSETANIYYYGNAGSSTSKGAELATQVTPVGGLHLSGWIAYITSKLDAEGVAGGAAGSLSLAPKWSGNIAIDDEFPLGGSLTGVIGGGATHLGKRGQSGLVFPAYTRIDLHAGVDYGDWEARLYANNVTNKRGIINGGPNTLIPTAFYYITPRMIGLNVSKTF